MNACNEILLGNFATLATTPEGQAVLQQNEATVISIYASSSYERKQTAALDSQLQGTVIYYNIWNHAVPELSDLMNAGSLLNPGPNAPSGAYLGVTDTLMGELGHLAGTMKTYFAGLPTPTYNAAYTVLPQYVAQNPLDPRPFVVFDAINSNPWTTEQTSALAVTIQQSSAVPSGYQAQDWGGYVTSPGFPSGHSTAGNTLAILTGIMAPQYYKDFLMAGIEFALSRNIFGVHHPIDTIGGRLIATYNIARWLNGDSYSVPLSELTAASAELQGLIGGGNGSPYAAACAGDVVGCIRAGAIPTAAEFAAPRDYYTYYLTYGLPSIGTTGLAPVVPQGAEALIASRFPYLSAAQRREVLVTTEIDSGSLFDNGSGWARLNLYAAADGFGALNCGGEGATGCIQVVTMSSAAGGYSAFDVWANDIGGDGGLELVGDGALVLAGNASYTGGTTVSGGLLAVSGSLVGAVTIAPGASFYNAGTVTAVGGSLIVNNGALLNDGTLASSVTSSGSFSNNGTVIGSVTSDGQYGGTGAITGNLDILAGTVAPGNSIGTVTVGGNVIIAPGAVYAAEIGAGGSSDLIAAGGTATVTGARLELIAQPGTVVGFSRFSVLNATGGVIGSFATVNDPFGAAYPFLDIALSYDAGGVTAQSVRSDVPLALAARTHNQVAVANALETIPTDTATSGPSLADAVFSLNFDTAPSALAQLAGGIGPSTASVLVGDSHILRDMAGARLRADADGSAPAGMSVAPLFYATPPASPAPFPTKAGTEAPAPALATLWAQGFGAWSTLDGSSNAAGVASDTGGFVMGADAVLADWRLGILGGYSTTSVNLDGQASAADADSWHAGIYAGRDWGALAVRAGIANSWSQIDTSRSVAFNGFAETLSGAYDASLFQAFGELGYGVEMGALRAEPFANLAYVRYAADSYSETGGEAALDVDSADVATTFSTLGLRVTQAVPVGGATGLLSAAIGWQHAFGDTLPSQSQSFAIGSSSFTTTGVPIAEDAALVEAGIALPVGPLGQLALAYGGQFGDGTTQNSVTAALRIRF
ncbi:autotransporter domain-containing protein [Ancylobacter sp. WKF20]|uniref:autotransporter family protein n=1 Tax=Ancylobacter sp. WKF20 TaxID=3039801 RepID=UPI00243436A9|nr:autotransporter domain-containing protein [Ancylobacter sp. WKF20]WGD32043.1 autotransporter domain-containing protein [Ancylobacter sp. WKF20]